MEKFHKLEEKHIAFIQQQHVFFVGTAAREGHVNLSPKGMDSLWVKSESEVVWLNLTGSGNETAAHIADINRMTIMFCSFEKQPLILRLYGKAEVIHPYDDDWDDYCKCYGAPAGARQFYKLDIEMVITSCGYAVPYYDFKEDRKTLANWAEKKGDEGIFDYWDKNNRSSLDGLPTYVFSDGKQGK